MLKDRLRPSLTIMMAQSPRDLLDILVMMFKWCVIPEHFISFGRSIDSFGIVGVY